MKNFMKNHGQALLDNGFQFVPISTPRDGDKSAGKRPILGSWQKIVVDQDSLDVWKDKYGRNGIGILTKNTPAVDIDSLDVDAAKHMRIFVESTCGFAPIRVGNAPKTLLLYRTDEPFSKVKSAVWTDDWGTDHAVEILGDGQQFVAYGIHPGTKKPYEWVSIESPLVNHASLDLEVITLDDARAIANEFDRYAMEQGWVLKQRATVGNHVIELGEFGSDDEDPDDWVTADDVKDKWEGSVEDLVELLADLPPEESYDKWYPVIAALKDAEREPDEFKEAARDWSARADNFDDDGFEDKWDNGNFTRGSGNVATISGIMKRVDDLRMEADIMHTVVPLFESAEDLVAWDRAAERLRETPVFGTIREYAIEVACDHYKRITGKKIPVATKKKALSVDHTQFDAPEWIKPWVFNQSDNVFIHKNSMAKVVPHAFNNVHAQDTLSFGVTPEVFATALRPIPIVGGTMYYPGMHGGLPDSKWNPVQGCDGDEFFRYNGQTWLNTFDPDTLPAMPEKLSKKGKKAADIVMDYFKTQFPDEKEFKYAMDWIAWVINNPGQKINYALIILGCEGSGKTIVKKFFSYLLGKQNVGTVSNQVLHKSFSSWQAGHILKVIEEISVSGHRYDVMNILKEPITNADLQIEKKGKDAVDQVNTASYMAYTNDIGALPLKQGNTRFLVLQSAFKQRQDVVDFMKEKPDFYKNFELAFTKYAGELRLWFSGWEYGDYFNAEGRAPADTDARNDMMDVAQDDFTNWILDAIEDENIPGITSEMIHAHAISIHCERDIRPVDRNIASRLQEIGFIRLGKNRYRPRLGGAQGTVYARDPRKWCDHKGEPNSKLISDHLQASVDKIEMSDKEVWDD